MNKKARVGLLNFQYSKDNYGAVLQAAALERLVKKRVENVEHIDYRPQRNRIRLLLSAIVKRLLNKNSRNDSNNALSSQGFESFRVKFISRTPIIFNKKKFRVESANYDAIIVGSDQVWRPTMGGDPLVFFLNYCNPSVRKISYAASFGLRDWGAPMGSGFSKRVKKALNDFDFVSVREDSGKDICRKFDVNAEHVLDPLLLVEDQFFDEIIANFDQESKSRLPSFVYYKLDTSHKFREELAELENNFKKVAHNLYISPDGSSYELVENWISYIFYSELVLTDSFHCLCLALRFGKPVLLMKNDHRGKARFDSFFKMFNIQIKSTQNINHPEIIYLEPPEDFNVRLEEMRKFSNEFLDNALSEFL